MACLKNELKIYKKVKKSTDAAITYIKKYKIEKCAKLYINLITIIVNAEEKNTINNSFVIFDKSLRLKLIFLNK